SLGRGRRGYRAHSLPAHAGVRPPRLRRRHSGRFPAVRRRLYRVADAGPRRDLSRAEWKHQGRPGWWVSSRSGTWIDISGWHGAVMSRVITLNPVPSTEPSVAIQPRFMMTSGPSAAA